MSVLKTSSRGTSRRLYPAGRSAPVVSTLFDGQEVDTNRFQIHRDFFVITTRIAGTPEILPEIFYPLGEYEDDNTYFNNQSSKTVFFSQVFTAAPIVVVNLEGTTGLENLVASLVTIATNKVTIELSANYTGNVRYRAINASGYPARVFDNPNNPTIQLLCTATQVSVVAANTFTASFNSLGSLPTNSFYTAYDLLGTQDTNVFLLTGSVGETLGSGDLSAAMTNRINFLALVPL